MSLLKRLFCGRKNNVEVLQKTPVAYICDLRTNSRMSEREKKAYVKTVIGGSYPDVNILDERIAKLIIDWTKNGEPINALTKLLKQIGVQFPVKLKDLSEATFICETSDNKRLSISMYFGDMFDYCDEIQVEDENGKTCRYIYFSSNVSLELRGTNIVKDEAKLTNYYCNSFCHRTLSLPNGYELSIEVDEPELKNENEICILQNAEAVETYLLNSVLIPIKSFYTCYEKIKECYQFDNDMIRAMPKFEMILSKKLDDKTSEMVEAIVIHNGELQLYVYTEGDRTISWSRDGSWYYKKKNDYLVSSNKDDVTVTFSVKKGERTSDVNVTNLIQSAEKSVIIEINNVIIP